MPMNKKPCVVAGLMATLGLGATLIVAPVTALADEAPNDEGRAVVQADEAAVESENGGALEGTSSADDGLGVVEGVADNLGSDAEADGQDGDFSFDGSQSDGGVTDSSVDQSDV